MQTFALKCIYVLKFMFVSAPYTIDLMVCLLKSSAVSCLMFSGPAHKRPPTELKRPQGEKNKTNKKTNRGEISQKKKRKGQVWDASECTINSRKYTEFVGRGKKSI